MLEIDWTVKRPNKEELEQMWGELRVEVVERHEPAIQEFVEVFRARIPPLGKVEFACFHLGENTALDFFASRYRLIEINFFPRFLTLPVVRHVLPNMKIEEPLLFQPEIERDFSIQLDGELAVELKWYAFPSPYGAGDIVRPNLTARDSRLLAERFCKELFQDRYDEVEVYSTVTPWSEWFWGNGMCRTWFGLDKRFRYLWVLCKTNSMEKEVRFSIMPRG